MRDIQRRGKRATTKVQDMRKGKTVFGTEPGHTNASSTSDGDAGSTAQLAVAETSKKLDAPASIASQRGYGDDYYLGGLDPLTDLAAGAFTRGRKDDEVEVSAVPGQTARINRQLPRIYVLVDRDDQLVTNAVHTRERDAYQEKREYDKAGMTTSVVPYKAAI